MQLYGQFAIHTSNASNANEHNTRIVSHPFLTSLPIAPWGTMVWSWVSISLSYSYR